VDTYQEAKLDALGDPNPEGNLGSHDRTDRWPSGSWRATFPVSRPAISQHLRVLKEAKLVVDRAVGNRRLYQLHPEGFATLREYFEQFWGQALQAFRRKVEEVPKAAPEVAKKIATKVATKKHQKRRKQ